MKKLFLLISLVCFLNCSSETAAIDQELRQKLFKECLENVPKGPDNVKYNDWAEVIEMCEKASYYQSLRVVSVDSVCNGIIKKGAQNSDGKSLQPTTSPMAKQEASP